MIVGLTGQTGAGKSTVSDYLRENGVVVIDADKIAREVVETGSACIADIALEFGCEYINMDGTLNRKKMARTVFNDKEKLKKLNNLMFPYIIDSIRRELKRLRNSRKELLCWMLQLCLRAVQIVNVTVLFRSQRMYSPAKSALSAVIS